mmetsp:Transcript_18287/g.45960  ORF Transcript_18287/g.45960 Transcript_18287/m.45960 type:complete len:359 (+) Transcript_18287:143-1219(+)|eukprot:jgi/Tetstr1/429253/TSEL_019172.t1
MADAATTYGVKFQARALAALPDGGSGASRWLVGTAALREENEVHLLEYDSELESVKCAAVLGHSAEVWAIAPAAAAADKFLTVHNSGGAYGISLWQMDTEGSALTELCSFPGLEGVVRSALWHPTDGSQVVSIEEGALRRWDLGNGSAAPGGTAPADALQAFWGGAWSAADPATLVTCAGNSLAVWDARSLARTAEVESAHAMPVRDIDISRHNAHHMVTAGDDCKLRLWDLRKLGGDQPAGEPLQELGLGHSHWVWQGRLNPAHDELILSSSSDCLVNLWHVPPDGGSPPPAGSRAAAPGGSGAGVAGLAHTFDEHDDSVYGAAWSETDPWVFATLSYDGRVVVNQVPNGTKYKILL